MNHEELGSRPSSLMGLPLCRWSQPTGRTYVVEALAELPLPDAEQARRRCREALLGRSN